MTYDKAFDFLTKFYRKKPTISPRARPAAEIDLTADSDEEAELLADQPEVSASQMSEADTLMGLAAGLSCKARLRMFTDRSRGSGASISRLSEADRGGTGSRGSVHEM